MLFVIAFFFIRRKGLAENAVQNCIMYQVGNNNAVKKKKKASFFNIPDRHKLVLLSLSFSKGRTAKLETLGPAIHRNGGPLKGYHLNLAPTLEQQNKVLWIACTQRGDRSETTLL